MAEEYRAIKQAGTVEGLARKWGCSVQMILNAAKRYGPALSAEAAEPNAGTAANPADPIVAQERRGA